MKILAIDTSSDACSVALDINNNYIESTVFEAKSHTQVLLPMINKLLDEANIKMNEVDAILLGIGPGSFIGMRIGASVAQGLAFAANIKIIPISSMEAIASDVMENYHLSRLVIYQDARMGESYVGEFRLKSNGVIQTVSSIKLVPLIELNKLIASSKINSFGIGFIGHTEITKKFSFNFCANEKIGYPKADILLKLNQDNNYMRSAIKPEELRLDYIRKVVANKTNKCTP